MTALVDALLVAAAFVVGAIPFGVLISRTLYGTDIRTSGSGNIGAANALRTLGKRGAVMVLLLDALKGFAPALAARALGGQELAALAGLAAVAGHCWSPFLGMRGGKGVATAFGVLFALWWWAALAFALVWIAAVLAWGFASVGSMLAIAAMGPVLWFGIGRAGLLYGVLSAILVIWRHRENLERLRSGTENRFSLMKPRRS